MTPRVALSALALTFVAVTLSHVEWQRSDNGHLLVLDGRPLDVLGWLDQQRNRLQRNCSAVQELQAGEAALQAPLAVLKEFSPPASRSARVAGAWALGDWMLLEVTFAELLPAVVLLQETDQGWDVAPQGVWSGQTHPWQAAPLIRAYLSRQVPRAPAPLLACFELRSPALKAQPGLGD